MMRKRKGESRRVRNRVVIDQLMSPAAFLPLARAADEPELAIPNDVSGQIRFTDTARPTRFATMHRPRARDSGSA